jgi:hypothetical protein
MAETENNVLSILESEALGLLLAGDLPVLKQLRDQVTHIIAVKRTFTAVGFFVDFELAENIAVLPDELSFAISDVGGQIDGTRYGAVFVLFIKSGRIECLEGATCGDDTWPKEIVHFKLGYDHGERDLTRLQEAVQRAMQKGQAKADGSR